MPFIASDAAPVFRLHGATFTGLAAPSRGATENAVWIVDLPAGTPGLRHRLSREETFVALAGRARAQIGDEAFEVTPGSALVVPAGAEFSLANPGAEPFRAVAVLPVGGQARVADGEPFTPPWAT